MPTDLAETRRRSPAQIEVPDGQVRILESHHAEGFEMPLGTWPFHKVCWVSVGRGMLESAGSRCALEPHSFLLLPAGWAHRFIDDPRKPLTLVILCISGKLPALGGRTKLRELWCRTLDELRPGTPLRARTAFHRSHLVEAFRLALQEQGDRRPGWEFILEAIACQVIVSFVRNHCEPREAHVDSSLRAVEGAIEFLDTHVHQRLTIEGVAARCHLSPRRFTTLFKQLTGETFSSYLNRRRIEYACHRLKETRHILYACHAAGFNDLAYFYRVFKKLTGQTPAQYLRGSH